MRKEEAYTVAVQRMHCGWSFSKIAGVCCLIYGAKRAKKIAQSEHVRGAGLGRDLVVQMERTLKLERCESDKMVMDEQLCMKCHHVQWAISYPGDKPNQCGKCGAFAATFVANTKNRGGCPEENQ